MRRCGIPCLVSINRLGRSGKTDDPGGFHFSDPAGYPPRSLARDDSHMLGKCPRKPQRGVVAARTCALAPIRRPAPAKCPQRRCASLSERVAANCDLRSIQFRRTFWTLALDDFKPSRLKPPLGVLLCGLPRVEAFRPLVFHPVIGAAPHPDVKVRPVYGRTSLPFHRRHHFRCAPGPGSRRAIRLLWFRCATTSRCVR